MRFKCLEVFNKVQGLSRISFGLAKNVERRRRPKGTLRSSHGVGGGTGGAGGVKSGKSGHLSSL